LLSQGIRQPYDGSVRTTERSTHGRELVQRGIRGENSTGAETRHEDSGTCSGKSLVGYLQGLSILSVLENLIFSIYTILGAL